MHATPGALIPLGGERAKLPGPCRWRKYGPVPAGAIRPRPGAAHPPGILAGHKAKRSYGWRTGTGTILHSTRAVVFRRE